MRSVFPIGLFAAAVLLSASALFASSAPKETRVYFSPYPARPEQVRTGRDLVQWRLNGQLFDEGPCLEGVPFPVLVGTPEQVQSLAQLHSTAFQTFGNVRGYQDLFPESSAPAPLAGMKAAINITNGYHDEEAVAALLLQFQTNFPALAQRIQIGSTHWQRPIWALKISDNVATEETEPRIVFDANIHAREYAGPEVALDIIWQLLYGYTNNAAFASWVDNLEIYVIPCLNPDGRYFCDTVSSNWRKNGRDNNRSGTMTDGTDGVDLNRNSAYYWGSDNTGSSATSSDINYRGPSPASEPEIQAYDALLQRLRPAYTFSIHSYMGVYYGPLGDYNLDMPAPDPFKPLGTNVARVCTNEDNSAYTYLSGPEFGYTVNGDRVDSNYGLYGIQAIGIELGSESAGFQPTYATTRDLIVPRVRLGWQKFLAAAHTNWPKIRGWSLDATNGAPAPVRIHSLNLTNRPNDEHWTSRADGFYECPLPTAGTYRVVFAPLGQASLVTTQSIVVGTTAKSTNLVFDVAPELGAPATNGIQTWSNQNENGTAILEYTVFPEGPWLPLMALATSGRTGQAELPASATTRYVRVRTSPRLVTPATNLLTTNLVFVPSGAFRMGTDGAADTNEQPAAAIHLDGYYIDAREVTFTNWTRVRIWATNNGYSFGAGQRGSGGAAAASNHPVVNVTWHDAAKWCNARSQLEGLLPAYYTTAGQTNIYKSNTVDLTAACVNWTANGYRLPTEAEWEKAARGGFTDREYPWGDAIAASNANYSASGINGTTNVALYPANGYGLRDAAGNAAEWCWDWSGSYTNRTSSNPTGPTSGTVRIVRGGSWSNAAASLRCAARTNLPPAASNTVVSLRCLRR